MKEAASQNEIDGPALKKIREGLGLSQAALASALGIAGNKKNPYNRVSDWETGRRPVPPYIQVTLRYMAEFGILDLGGKNSA